MISGMDEYLWMVSRGGDDGDFTEKQVAESLRYLISDSQYQQTRSRDSHDDEVLKVYTKLMSTSLAETGINNYAETILPLITNERNESDSWEYPLDFHKYAAEQNLLCPDDPTETLSCRNKIKSLPGAIDSVSENNGAQSKASTTRLKLPSYYQSNAEESHLPTSIGCSLLKQTQNQFSSIKQNNQDLLSFNRHNAQHLLSSNRQNNRDHLSSNSRRDDDLDTVEVADSFRSAREQLILNNAIKNRQGVPANPNAQGKKSLGPRRGAGKFISPLAQEANGGGVCGPQSFGGQTSSDDDLQLPKELAHLDPKIVELIMNEIMDVNANMTWDEVAGLDFAKKTINEVIVLPMLRPDIFSGLRGPPKGLLLFGPPGTGKTLIGKCVASQSGCTFFSISASSLTSKWIGEGEKMVRALFSVARYKQPAVVFIDEIDSLLTQRSESEHESSRRIKTEFLVQMDGVGCDIADQILVIGATNRPSELDEAARRRFVKRLYIPLPEATARAAIVQHLMKRQEVALSSEDLEKIVALTPGYSGADMTNLCKEAALGPVRDIRFEDMATITLDQVRPINYQDFKLASKQVRASVDSSDLNSYLEWNAKFGSWEIKNL